MPTFLITGPDGAQYRVTAPEGASEQDVLAHIQQQSAPAVDASTQQDTSVIGDVAKSAGIGAVKGALGTLGTPGDLGSLASGAVDWAANALGANPDKVQQFKDMSRLAAKANPLLAPFTGPTSQDLQKNVEGVTGEFYKPKTVAGEYAQTAGEFLPAMIGGPEGLGTKLLTRVAAPAIASETAGQATKGTALEPYARIAGGIVGGAGASKLASIAATPRNAVPSANDLLSTAGNQFNAVRDSGAAIPATDVQNIAQRIRNSIVKEGADPGGQKLVFDTLDRLEAKGLSGAPVPYGEIDTLRKNLNNLKLSPDGGTRNFAKQATNELMSELTGALPANVSGTLKEAIANYAAGKRSNTVMGKAALADLNAATAGAGGNIDNASRQAVKQLIRPINNDIVPQAKRMGFNDAEIAQMNVAARGTNIGNSARLVGKLAPTGVVSAAMSGGSGFAVGGPLGAVALPAVGAVAKAIGDMSTKRAIKSLDTLVRSRSPLAAQVAAQLPQVAAQLSPSSAALLSGLVSLQASKINQPAY